MKRKIRRESGRKYNKNYNPEQGEYYEQYWDDWNDHRDGYRDLTDKTKKKPKHINKEHWTHNKKDNNKKIEIQTKIRKIRNKK